MLDDGVHDLTPYKRPRTPEQIPSLEQFHHQRVGWSSNAESYDLPTLPDQSWNGYMGELLGSELLQGIDPSYDGGEGTSNSLTFAQEQIEQWATENAILSPQLASTGPELQESQVCYGTIYRVSVKLCGDMGELDNKLAAGEEYPVRGHYQMGITRSEERYVVTFPDGTVLGEVNEQLKLALMSIAQRQLHLDLEVFSPIMAIRETMGRAVKEKDAIVRVYINLYGNRSSSHNIGQVLSQNKLYLQRPDYIRDGISYDNPHLLKFPGFETEYSQNEIKMEINERSKVVKAEPFEQTISDVYSSLTRGHELVGLEGDNRLKTGLLQHQKTALDFMIQREDGPIPEKYRLWEPVEIEGKACYLHVITKTRSLIEQTETGGGILADEMGMGKTLSILALILHSSESAFSWATDTSMVDHDTPSIRKRCRSKATLVIASSDLMINEWFQEIDRHFDGQVASNLRRIKYHGRNREISVAKLCNADIVITTYHTLASDFQSSKNPLSEIEWYRLVLDEAHIIRRQATGLYRNVADLWARSRWCLTGTPVQNRLEDIGSLFAFLRLTPFHSMSNFRKHIALPFDEGGKRRTLAIANFTRLLDSVCLRRLKDLLHLPVQRDRVRMIQLTPDERRQYEQTKDIMFRAIRNQVGVFDQKSTLGMFQVQLQLRIFCNHGTWQQPFSWNRRKLNMLDEREAMEALLDIDSEVTCSACTQTMPLHGTGTMYQRYAETCRHTLCSECLGQFMSNDEDKFPEKCPLCPTSVTLTSHGTSRLFPSTDEHYFQDRGRSTKMETLMNDVLEDIGSTKSIIFSCWTRTLDLIEIYLQRYGLNPRNFERIDGECATKKRERILEEFAENPSLKLLIMTTGTGAVGLNLATANRVFIVEPQWNPSVENQAVARALRLGQKHSVEITRYIVDKTVELDMQGLQKKKLRIANMARGS